MRCLLQIWPLFNRNSVKMQNAYEISIKNIKNENKY